MVVPKCHKKMFISHYVNYWNFNKASGILSGERNLITQLSKPVQLLMLYKGTQQRAYIYGWKEKSWLASKWNEAQGKSIENHNQIRTTFFVFGSDFRASKIVSKEDVPILFDLYGGWVLQRPIIILDDVRAMVHRFLQLLHIIKMKFPVSGYFPLFESLASAGFLATHSTVLALRLETATDCIGTLRCVQRHVSTALIVSMRLQLWKTNAIEEIVRNI